MPQYIKSHSNYVLKKKHQEVNNGDIYERDITTIGGLNQFAPGQIPIYKSGNFIITVGNKDTSSRSIINERWEESTSGEVWTMNTIDASTSSNDIENDLKIVLKQDYYDLSDFAYFGSCSELIRASLTDILARFPGLHRHSHELFSFCFKSKNSTTAPVSSLTPYIRAGITLVSLRIRQSPSLR